MPRFPSRALLLIGLAAGLAAAPLAAGPVFWTVATSSEFLRGTSDGVYVSLEGIVTPGPQLDNRLASAPPQIWSLVSASDGTLWAGTGSDGRVVRVRPNQKEETVFDAEEAHVFALTTTGNRVYAATSPDGRVFVIEGTAAAKPFFDPTEKYIWALAVDSTGRLWVGAGNPAVIYRVDATGQSQVVYRPPAAHVVSLTADRNGRMLAGTESPGRLYRLEADGRPFVLLEPGMTEVRATSVASDGVIFAAAVSRGEESAASSGETTTVAITTAPAPTPGSAPPPSAPPSRRSALYRIEPNGTWEAIWETPDVTYDVAATDDGGVLAATGPDGRLYKVTRNRDVLLLTGVDAKQITRFAGPLAAGRPSAFATANPGRIVSVGAAEHSPATYISSVRDTKSVATWGLVRWEGGGSVVLYTRSGNTEKPDDSWSEWAGPYSRREGDAIKSPAARFLQWKAVLTRSGASAPPRLTSVTVAYLPRNSRPLVSSITVHPPGVVFQRPFSSDDGAIAGLDDLTAEARRPPGDTGAPTPPPGRRMFEKGLQTLAWRAEDGDADKLLYSLHYRREGESEWRELRTGLTDPIYVWDTTTVADGRYVIRLTASDSPSNAADRQLSGDRESDPIAVDNTPPAITTEIERRTAGARLIVRVRDAQSPIQKVEYSLGGGGWQLVYPADGLSDSQEERYEIPLAREGDAARLVIRATDLLQNVTSQAVAVR